MFMKRGFFPNSNKITNYTESFNYWIFKTGKKLYKVKKREDMHSSVALEEVFCSEVVRQIRRFSPELEPEIATVKKRSDSYILDKNDSVSSEVLYYAIIMNQLPNRQFLNAILEKEKLTEKIIEQVSAYLGFFHDQAEIYDSKDKGTFEDLNSQLQNLYYQSKKYLGITISQAIVDMTLRPLEKFLADNKKSISRRIRKGHIKHIHGCFLPRKIHVTKNKVVALPKTTDPLRNRYSDVASDVADLTVELRLAGQEKLADFFIAKYCKTTSDKEIHHVLPIYQALKCLALGLQHSIGIKHFTDKEAEEQKKLAVKYYEQTINVVHQL